MSLVTKPSGRKSTNIAEDLIVHNHPQYPEDEKGVHPSRRPQRTSLIAEKTPMKISVEYADFADVFFPDLASKLPEHIGINDYAIELINANRFIRPSKLPTGALILFDQKTDRSLLVVCRL